MARICHVYEMFMLITHIIAKNIAIISKTLANILRVAGLRRKLKMIALRTHFYNVIRPTDVRRILIVIKRLAKL